MSDTARSDRPRKKKKQKKSNKGLLIGLAAGAAALIAGVVVFFLVFAKGTPETPKKVDEPLAPVVLRGYVRPVKEDVALDKLKQIGIAYHAYVNDTKKGPKEVRELGPFLKDPELMKTFAGSMAWIELRVNWMPLNLPDGSSRTIVAFEKEPFEGKRVVLMGDTSAKLVSEEDFMRSPRVSPEGKIVAGPLVLEGGKTRLGKYVRLLNKFETEITLKKIGDCYIAYVILNNRGPKELSELDCARDKLVAGALDSKDGWLYVIWSTGRVSSETIIAYEREPYGGMHYVIWGNGGFSRISEEDLARAPKAKGD